VEKGITYKVVLIFTGYQKGEFEWTIGSKKEAPSDLVFWSWGCSSGEKLLCEVLSLIKINEN